MRQVRQTGRGCGVRQACRAFVLVALLPVMSLAQTPAAQNVEVDPVTCWWRPSVTSVRVGQTFAVILTCSALETEAARAVIDRSRLGSAAVQFPPYEVVGGSQSADHVTAGRRFMQYEYLLRLVGEDTFGVDVPIAGMDVTYRIESRVQPDSAVQGREQSYELPAIAMRVASLVPDTARDIRESSVPTFGAIAAREFRARMFRVVAITLFAVAALTIAVAAVRWIRQNRTQSEQAARPLLPNRAVLAGVRAELRAIQQATRGEGWSTGTVARALAAARIVASYLTGRAVVQQAANRPASGGELLVAGGWLPRRRIAVSGTTTAAPDGAVSAELGATDLDSALRQLTTARYGRSQELDAPALGDALETVMRAADRAAARHTWLAEAAGSLRQTARGWRPRAWAR